MNHLLFSNLLVIDMFDKLYNKLYGWYDSFILKLPNLAIAILVVVASYFIARGVSSLIDRLLSKHLQDKSVRSIIDKLVHLIIIAAGFFIALGVLDLDQALTSLLAGAGVVALAIGLALQSTLSNTFSGVMLSFQPKIRIGDFVETNGYQGFVTEINLRNITLRQPDNKFVIMPNSKFIEEPFTNYGLETRGRVTVSCGVAYGSDLREVERLVREIVQSNFEQQHGEKIEFYFTEFADSSINFMTRFNIDYVKKSQMFHAQHQAILLINDIFAQNNINIPFPIRTLDFPKGFMESITSREKHPNT
jgi:small conductance mechanosensitive channel